MSAIEVLGPRDVPLGGLRALSVRRTLPSRSRSFIGAWCFIDHYGPAAVGAGNDGGMDVPPHPHTGLQTVSWLFAGQIEHRDSGGVTGLVRPGEVNLMTAGYGIAHSEVSACDHGTLHGVQLWVALPDHARNVARGFEHHAPERRDLPGGGSALVFLGELPGAGSSPVRTYTPLLGAQLDLAPGAGVTLAADPAWEHGLLADSGTVTLEGQPLSPGELGYAGPGRAQLRVRAGDEGARAVLLGGEPFEEEIVMWWNFVGRSHEEIVQFRAEWEAGSDRFGRVPGYAGRTGRIRAPRLPGVRLRPRSRPREHGGGHGW